MAKKKSVKISKKAATKVVHSILSNEDDIKQINRSLDDIEAGRMVEFDAKKTLKKIRSNKKKK